MLKYPEFIQPEIFRIGPVAVRWYGLMYVLGFLLGAYILKRRARAGYLPLSYKQCDSLLTYLIIGMLIGARSFYVLFYNFTHYMQNPSRIIAFWEGGLSFHGAALGMTLACLYFARVHKVSFLKVADSFAFAAAPGLFLGRLGNFANRELYGRVSDVPWAIVFPGDPEGLPRHPSQLYQGLTEGLMLFGIMWLYQRWALKRDRLKAGLVGCVFLMGYGFLRFFVEFFRQPDAQFRYGGYTTQAQCLEVLGQMARECQNHMGTVLWGLSMGQLLCVAMFLIGLGIYLYLNKKEPIFRPHPPKEKFLTA